MPHVTLLGAPAIMHGDERHEPPTGKSSALLYYLAYHGQWVARDELVYLLWPDHPEEQARQNLRQLLTSLRKLPYVSHLETETGRLRWSVRTDVQAFREALADRRLDCAVQLYRGELLHGFRLTRAPEFDRWLELERQDLHRAWREAVTRLSDEASASGQHAQAADLLRTVHRADPLDEAVVRRLLEALHASGQRDHALELFRSFRQLFADELDAEPERATLELMARIGDEDGADGRTLPLVPSGHAPHHNLPSPATPFVGREDERAAVLSLLNDPACRLVTLAGPGGIGKTRLAVETARAEVTRFRDGVFFVPLASTGSAERIVFAIAEAIGYSFSKQDTAQEQLLAYLRDKVLLLVLDNLEHLLTGTPYLSTLLEHAPHIKVLATSRERLNLQAERVLDIRGLSVPEGRGPETLEHDAVQLFALRAAHVRADFHLDDVTLPAVVRICQLVQGMPLALELAATWLRALTPEDIAAEIERGIDVLEAATRDLPLRHRSIRAVFDASWNLLNPQEQTALARLSVFRGGFRRDAAVTIAGASLGVLAGLVDKSFLTRSPHGRYHRHPLVLQYSQEQLARHPDEQLQIRQAHSRYYLRFVRENETKLMVSEDAFQVVEEELANIRAAWTWALENEQFDQMVDSVFALNTVFTDRAAEGEQLFAQTSAALDPANPQHHTLLGHVLVMRAGHMNHVEEAAPYVRQGLELLGPTGDSRIVLYALYLLGLQMWVHGDLDQAKALLEEALLLARKHPEFGKIGTLLHFRTLVEREFGSFAQVSRTFQEAIAEVERLHDPIVIGPLKHEYGMYLSQHDRSHEGERHVLEGLELIRRVRDKGFECNILVNLALLYCRLGKYDDAEAVASEALEMARVLNYRDMEAMVWDRRTRVALARGQLVEAERCLTECLRIAWTWRHQFSIVNALIMSASLLLAKGKVVEAAERLGLVRVQQGFLNEHRLEVGQLLGVVRQQLPEPELEQALARGEAMALTQVVNDVMSRP